MDLDSIRVDLNPDLDLRKKLAIGFDLDLSSLTGLGFDLGGGFAHHWY